MLVKSKLKYIQSLGQKKFRDSELMYIAEGPKIVGELLKEIPGQFEGIYALNEWIAQYGHLQKQVEITEVSEIELARISQLHTPNMVVAVIKQNSNHSYSEIPPDSLTLLLDNIQDPGNLGTIIRTADWFGVKSIFCSMTTADLYNPKVIQAAMGSIARVDVYYNHLAPLLQKQRSMPVYAALLEGKDVQTIGKIRSGILIIGNESKGVSDELLGYVTQKITIPGRGGAESLNAAVATAIMLSHLT